MHTHLYTENIDLWYSSVITFQKDVDSDSVDFNPAVALPSRLSASLRNLFELALNLSQFAQLWFDNSRNGKNENNDFSEWETTPSQLVTCTRSSNLMMMMLLMNHLMMLLTMMKVVMVRCTTLGLASIDNSSSLQSGEQVTFCFRSVYVIKIKIYKCIGKLYFLILVGAMKYLLKVF